MLAIEEDMKNLRMEIARLESARDKKKAEHDLQVGGCGGLFWFREKKKLSSSKQNVTEYKW